MLVEAGFGLTLIFCDDVHDFFQVARRQVLVLLLLLAGVREVAAELDLRGTDRRDRPDG